MIWNIAAPPHTRVMRVMVETVLKGGKGEEALLRGCQTNADSRFCYLGRASVVKENLAIRIDLLKTRGVLAVLISD